MTVRGKKVVVVGLGETALALVRLLLEEGAHPFVTERDAGERLAPLRIELDTLGVPYECGRHSDHAFEGAALVVPSPGVPPTIAPIVQARSAGAEVVGEMELAFPYCSSRILAVTGTNGKTTTTELVASLVAACGHSVLLAGNNKLPFSAAVRRRPTPEYIVLEVSSYQLETSRTFRPWIGAVLNVTPDHLARHGSIEAYAAVKARLLTNQMQGDEVALNADDPLVMAMSEGLRSRVWPFSQRQRQETGLWVNGANICLGNEVVASVSDTVLPGKHNIENVLAALSMMRAGGFDWLRTLAGLRVFEGVEHRIEHVATIRDVAFYNDSKSTNIDSLRAALESFDTPVVLLAGGRGKGEAYGVLRDLVKRKVKHLVAFGEDAPLLEGAFGSLVPTERATDMDDAVRRGAAAAAPGDIVLLSPACASFDMYLNFEHRGRVFKESVRNYRQETET